MTNDAMFSHLHDDDLDAVTKQIARDAFKARTPEDRQRIAADYRAALDESARRGLAHYRAAARKVSQ